MGNRILVDLQRCTGCWTCVLACKVGNGLADDEWWSTVRTLGSGEGIDRPAGIWPNLHMEWMPVYTKSCIMCAPRVKEGFDPYCAHNCPVRAISFGDPEDPESDFSTKLTELKGKGFRVFQLPEWENTKREVFYASKK